MLEEKYSTSGLVQGIEGQVTVELFDATSGRLVQREETHNFIAKPAVDFLEQAQRTIFKKGIYNLNRDLMNDYQLLDKQDAHIVLTDFDGAEDPEHETHMYGRPLGWASRTVYTGSDPMRGSVNVALSGATPSQCKWVFDWPTHAANGVIKSVGWSKALRANYGVDRYDNLSNPGSTFDTAQTSGAVTYATASSLVAKHTVTGGSPSVICKGPNNTYFGSRFSHANNSSNNSYQVTLLSSTFQQTGNFSISGAAIGYVRGLAWDEANSRLWVLGSAFKIAAFSSAGVLIADSTITIPSTSSGFLYRGLAYDGQYLWVGDNSAMTYTSATSANILRVNPDDGGVVSSFTFPFQFGGVSTYSWSGCITDISCDTSRSVLWVRISPSYNNAYYNASNSFREIKAFDYDGQPAALSVFTRPWSTRPDAGADIYGFYRSGSNIAYGHAAGQDTYDEHYGMQDTSYSNTLINLDGGRIEDYSAMGRAMEYLQSDRFLCTDQSSGLAAEIIADGMGSRALLPSPIAKTDTQTLRITYQVNFS